METVCVRVRLKPGSLSRVRERAAELQARSGEVLETLVTRAFCRVGFLRVRRARRLPHLLQARSLEEAHEAVKGSTHPIDEYHQRFKADTWASRTPLELLIDFENFD